MKILEFKQAFDRLIDSEGNYVNNPKDPGGETKFGISKRTYPGVDIKNLTLEAAKDIYFHDFWTPLGDTHPAIKFQVFDFAVNSGIPTAIRKLQTAVGAADDGHWGPISQKALNAMDMNDILLRYLAERIRFWASLSTWAEFGKGWARRAADNLYFASEDN